MILSLKTLNSSIGFWNKTSVYDHIIELCIKKQECWSEALKEEELVHACHWPHLYTSSFHFGRLVLYTRIVGSIIIDSSF
jgi:hypothetical protein